MGVFSTLLAYQIGKRRGKRKSEPQQHKYELPDEPDCIHRWSFCEGYGACLGPCEYEES